LGKYLGFKISQGRVTHDNFGELVDRVHSKLHAWKSRLLNNPGRVTLVIAVIALLPTYGMQIQWYL